MTIQFRAGGASDVGQLRTVNEDSMFIGSGIFVVADGMGGHQGGDVASSMAIEVFDRIGAAPLTVAELVARVHDANERVYRRSGTDTSLTGMGTTLVAIAPITEAGEERVAIVNVGDSRAYRLTGGQLEQVSDDHSLVGEMVRDGRLSREQAQDHPQKNIVTRAIGIDAYVEVDEFQLLPHAGDRYLLCSDGLTDEVDDDAIATVLRTIDDPEDAARELVRRANDHGGRDNITVVIVDVTDDGGIDEAAAAAVPDADGFSHDPEIDTQTFMALPDDQAHAQGHGDRPSDADTEVAVDGAGTAAGPDEARTKRPRAVTIRSVAFVVVVLALIGGGAYLANDYATSTFHLDVDDGEVVVLQGRPGGWLWYDAEIVERTDIDADDVPAEFADDVDANKSFATLERAETYLGNVENRIDDLTPPPTTSTTTTQPTTTTRPTTTRPTTTTAGT